MAVDRLYVFVYSRRQLDGYFWTADNMRIYSQSDYADMLFQDKGIQVCYEQSGKPDKEVHSQVKYLICKGDLYAQPKHFNNNSGL